jgi:polyisoprenoid-binding protein YceI
MRYVLDPSHGRFTVQAFSRGLLAGLGHSPTFNVRDFAGELDFDPGAPERASARVAVRADSLTVAGQVSPSDREEIESRMRREVLETAAYPEIIFQSAEAAADRIADGWYRLRLAGELRLHGVKGRHQLEAQLRLADGQVRLSGQCAVAMSAYRIREVTALAGMIRLKDEVKLDFDLVGSTKEE